MKIMSVTEAAEIYPEVAKMVEKLENYEVNLNESENNYSWTKEQIKQLKIILNYISLPESEEKEKLKNEIFKF